jgi:hypothetical protein
MSIEEAGGNFKFSIESLNNLSKHWTAQYCQFYIEVAVIHDKTPTIISTQPKNLKASNHDFILFEETVSFPFFFLSFFTLDYI